MRELNGSLSMGDDLEILSWDEAMDESATQLRPITSIKKKAEPLAVSSASNIAQPISSGNARIPTDTTSPDTTSPDTSTSTISDSSMALFTGDIPWSSLNSAEGIFDEDSEGDNVDNIISELLEDSENETQFHHSSLERYYNNHFHSDDDEDYTSHNLDEVSKHPNLTLRDFKAIDIGCRFRHGSTLFESENPNEKLSVVKAIMFLGSETALGEIIAQFSQVFSNKIIVRVTPQGEVILLSNPVDGDKEQIWDSEQVPFEELEKLNPNEILVVKVINDPTPVRTRAIIRATRDVGTNFTQSAQVEVIEYCWEFDKLSMSSLLTMYGPQMTASIKQNSIKQNSIKQDNDKQNNGNSFPNRNRHRCFSFFMLSAYMLLVVLVLSGPFAGNLKLIYEKAIFPSPQTGKEVAVPSTELQTVPTPVVPSVYMEPTQMLSTVCIQSKDAIEWLLHEISQYVNSCLRNAEAAINTAINSSRGTLHKVQEVVGTSKSAIRGVFKESFSIFEEVHHKLNAALEAALKHSPEAVRAVLDAHA